MNQQVNEVYQPLFFKSGNIRYVFLMGGRGAGRSTVGSQFAVAKLRAPEYFRCAIMRFILSDIRNSIYKEITDRVEESGVTDVEIVDNTMTLTCGENSINAVGFRKSSGDQKSKLKSLASYNTIIVEEADEIPEPDFMQLDDSLRTMKGEITVIFMLNCPPVEHWIIRRFFDLKPIDGLKGFYWPVLKPEIDNALFIHTTYLDNLANISPQTVKNYEGYATLRPNYYYHMIKGYVPEVVQGKIYNGWEVIDSVPHEARRLRRGLDFGYTNDPSALVDIFKWNGAYIIDELAYGTGMSNRVLADACKDDTNALVIADSAEPKSIDEIRGYGINVLPSQKGQGSVLQGIQFVQDQRIFITRRSLNVIKDYNNYAWEADKEGAIINEPKHAYSHGMDAVRYAIAWDYRPEKDEKEQPVAEETPAYLQIGI